ncbi:hypothetical protein KJ780_04020 [Candidatus Micrarchaeota archaeon]|nr:hypothetical protein [Candidatus Micrarchaeota archaeon]
MKKPGGNSPVASKLICDENLGVVGSLDWNAILLKSNECINDDSETLKGVGDSFGSKIRHSTYGVIKHADLEAGMATITLESIFSG